MKREGGKKDAPNNHETSNKSFPMAQQIDDNPDIPLAYS